MKKLLLLLISSLLVISTANAQIYKLTATNDKQTYTTCKGMVTSSGYVEGPSNTYYESNDGDYYTFYSGGGPLRINFNYANFDSYLYNGAYDQLEIWDKSTPTGAATWILKSTAYGQNDHKYFTSSTGYITVRLNTNGDGWGGASGTGQPNGWQAFLGCTPAGCNGNLPASDVCSSAPVICNLDGYCGATSGWYTADNVSTLESTLLGCSTGGWTIQNNSWLAFIANNSTATFTIKSSNCSDASKGMQAVVLATTNCTSFTIKSTCIYDGQGTFSLTASALTVGTKYYIMIDGGFGNDCDYTVSADSGIEEVKVDKTSATICEGSSVSITASGGLSYKWMPGGATTATINVSPTTSTTYTCTVTGKCDVETPTCVVTVKPKPVASATPNPLAFCSGGTTNIALTSSLASTTYAWIAVKTGGTTTGSSNGSGSSIAQTLTATSTTPGVVTYNVTPTTNGCSGNNLAIPVTVNPLPTVTTTPASQTFCSGGTTGIALTSNLAGTTFSWTVLSSTGVSGASAGSGTTIAQTLTATGTVAGTVTYEITPTSAAPASCPGTKKTVSITVNPRPTITPTVTAQNLCSGGSTSIGLQSDISGATYTWTVAVTGGVTGASNGSGSNIVQTLTASGTTTGTVEYTITATTPAPASCSNSAVTKVLVTVYPIPTISINTPAAICVGQSVSLTATVAPAGGTFSWTPGNLTTNPINVSPTTTTSYNCQYTVNGCSHSASRNVTVNPLPSVVINTSSTTICAGKTTTLTASSPDAGGTYLWAPGGATTPAITVSPAGNTTYTVTYTLATTCAQTATSAITVNTVPTVTVTPTSASICAGVSTTLNTNANPAGGTYAWAPGGATTPSITVSPSSSTTYTLTYTGVNGCSLSNSSAAITVTPLDNANFSYAKSTYCGNASDTVPTITGIPGGTFTATPAGLVFLNTTTGEIRPSTSTINTTYAIKYTTNGTCPNSKTVSLTIATNPTADFGFDFTTYCQYAGTVSPTFIGASSAGTFSATPAGLVFVSANTGVIDLNTSTPGSYLVRNIIAKNGTCNADTSDFVPITITAAPVLTPSSKNQSICSPSATNITLSGGTSYDWTVVSPVTITGASNATGDVTGVIAQTLTTSDVVPGIVHYIVTPKGGTGCIGKSDSVHIIVNPVPTVSATPVTPTVCSGLVTDIKLSSNIPTATFSWTVSSSTGASGAIGGTGPIIAQALTATTSVPGVVVYHIIPSAFGSCDGAPIDVSVTVNPNPTTVITIPSADQTICSGETTNIHLTSSTDSTKFTWTVNQTGVSGGSNGSGTDINQLLTVLGSTPGKAIYSIVGSSNGCSGSTAIDSVTVNPIPTLIVTPLKQEICSGSQTNIALVSNVPGAIFSWTITPRSITGGANGSTGVGNIIQTLTNPGSLADSVTYHIVATVDGCSSNMAALVDSVEASIIVNPKPIAYAASPVNICSGDTTNIVITGSVAGSTFSYKAITASVIGSGDGSGDTIKQVLSVNTLADFVTYTIIPTSLQGCIGNPTDVTVNVNPRPTITFQPSSSQSICSGSPVSVTMVSNVAGTIISWTPRTSIITGANSGSGPSPVLITDVLSVLGDTAETIIYDVTASAGGCSNTALSSLLQFTVNPLPKIIASAKAATICDGDFVNIALSSNVVGTDFNWVVSQSGVTGAFVDSNKTEIKQALNLTGNVAGTVVYTITSNSPGGCKGGATETVVITVNPLDNPAFHYSSLKYCQNALDPTAIITGGVPGVFTAYPAGLFITDPLSGKINLNASTPGDYIIQFTTSGKCSQKGYQNVIINPAPSANTDSLKIGDSNCGTLTGTITGITTVSGTAPFKYQWKNSSGVLVDTTLILDSVPPGIYTLTITDANGCSATAGNGNGFDIKFLQTVTADFTSDVSSGDTPLPVQFTDKSTYTGIINYFWDFDNGNTSTVKDPTMTFDAPNTYNVCLYVDDGGKGCRDTLCQPIEVFTNADITIVPNVFTPNGDGVNDVLMITARGLGAVDAQIYNRWGQIEYEWHTLNGGWDGFSASGVPAAEGTYYIILQAVGADKNKTKFPPIKQSFTLLR